MTPTPLKEAKTLAAQGNLADAQRTLSAAIEGGKSTFENFQYLLDLLAYQNDSEGSLAAYRKGTAQGHTHLALNQYYFNVIPKIRSAEALSYAVATLSEVIRGCPQVNRYAYLSLAKLLARSGRIAQAVLINQRIFDPIATRLPDELHAPAFIVAGTVKGGTTSFYDYLSLHPDIRSALFKEVRFFNIADNYAMGKTWYYSHFPQDEHALSGEATPGYFSSITAPERIKELTPLPKLFICLRDPVARAVSHHHMDVREGRTTDDLTTVLRRCKAIISGPSFPENDIFKVPYSISDSFYVHHMTNWLRHIPRENIHIVRAEDLLMKPQAVLDAACDFLGISHIEIKHTVKSNVGEYKEDAGAREALREYLLPFNQGLEELLGCRFDWLHG